MIVCEICGRSDFKNTQGLRGHMTFVHGKTGSSKILSAPAATEQRLSELEQLLGVTRQNTEQATEQLPSRLRERLGLTDSNTQPITEQLAELSELVGELSEQVELAQVTKGMLEANEAEFNKQLEQLRSEFKDSYSKLVEVAKIVNNNSEVAKQGFTIVEDRLALFFQVLDEHRHTAQGGAVLGSSAANKLFDVEVAWATKRRGKLPKEAPNPNIVAGKVDDLAFKYLPLLDLSIRKGD